MSVYKCPVCNGTGLVPVGFYNPDPYYSGSTNAAPEKCKSCNGTGIVSDFNPGKIDGENNDKRPRI